MNSERTKLFVKKLSEIFAKYIKPGMSVIDWPIKQILDEYFSKDTSPDRQSQLDAIRAWIIIYTIYNPSNPEDTGFLTSILNDSILINLYPHELSNIETELDKDMMNMIANFPNKFPNRESRRFRAYCLILECIKEIRQKQKRLPLCY